MLLLLSTLSAIVMLPRFYYTVVHYIYLGLQHRHAKHVCRMMYVVLNLEES